MNPGITDDSDNSDPGFTPTDDLVHTDHARYLTDAAGVLDSSGSKLPSPKQPDTRNVFIEIISRYPTRY